MDFYWDAWHVENGRLHDIAKRRALVVHWRAAMDLAYARG